MKTVTIVKNWVESTTPTILESIHQNNVSIAIYNRNISILKKEINTLQERDFKFDFSGSIDTILEEITRQLQLDARSMIVQDIQNLLLIFKKITDANGFRLLLTTIKTNMCRKFHVDINDLRLLCTYGGPGTLWLTEDNINRIALGARDDNKSIVIDKNNIKQAKIGSVIILKGARYPKEGTKAIVHRSPTIEKSGEKRLLLRIDTK